MHSLYYRRIQMYTVHFPPKYIKSFGFFLSFSNCYNCALFKVFKESTIPLTREKQG